MTFGYIAGSIPFGIVVSKVLGLPDPRTVGSKNIGFTNVLRVSGKKAGLLTLLGDVAKGWGMAWAASRLLQTEALVLAVALSPIVGHLFSLFLGFKGGKGVATAIGVAAGLDLRLGGILLAIWLAVAATTRYSSGAALSAFAGFPIIAWLMGFNAATVSFACLVSVLIFWKHRGNIERLLAGTESKMGGRPEASAGMPLNNSDPSPAPDQPIS